MDRSPPGSYVHGIPQARIPEWAAMLSPRGSSWPRDRTCISYVSCAGRQVLYHKRHLESPPWVYGLRSSHCGIKAPACWGLARAGYWASLAWSAVIPLAPADAWGHGAIVLSTRHLKEGRHGAGRLSDAPGERFGICTKGFRDSISGRERSARERLGKGSKAGWFPSSCVHVTSVPGQGCVTLSERRIEWDDTAKWGGFHPCYEGSTG